MSQLELEGATVAVLRVGDGTDEVAAALDRHGATATTVRVASIEDRSDADVTAAVAQLDRFAWVAVTSANAARRLALWAATWPAATQIAAVGAATSAAVGAVGLRCEVVSSEGTAVSLARCIDAGPVLFLAASSARADLAHELAGRGIEVTTIVAYDVSSIALDPDAASRVLACDVLVAMAPSAIDALVALDALERDAARRIPVVCFGPSSADRAALLHWPVTVVAARRDPCAVTDAVRVALGR